MLKNLGYMFQKIDIGLCRAIEQNLLKNQPDDHIIHMPLISVCGSPRTGTTLTFQILTQALNTMSITNLAYLFYRTPLVGYRISKWFTKPYVSDYHSDYGFIKGLNGPAQAYMFWKYFCDQNLFETKTNPTEKRLKNLIDALNAIYAIDNRPFLTGFLGHAMYIDQLVELFEKAVIVRVKRQMLASALSMLKYIKRSDGSFGPLGSAIPRQCQDISDLTPHQQVAHQVFFINRGLDAYQEKYKNLIFEADYNKTCSSPQQFIEKVEEFLNQNRIQVKLRTDVKLPKAFQPHIVSRSQNEDTRKIADELDALVESFGPVSVQCY